ncbi:MAG: prepilin-type N-terminal cleavage/methylation domain-containing protein, partial [Fusobacterium sp.]|nr:prepilin-type N-terminal cleavage/methylation domain-containing protein [Fusobacterium sp.]
SSTGFTMAEILLSLTIIGVVAAITLPSLTGNINERTWNTQRKALYARMSQAVPLMGSVNGYADTETFVTGGLSKVLKINNICDKDHLQDCGITSKLTTLNASQIDFPKTMQALNSKMTEVSVSNWWVGHEGEYYTYSQGNTDAAAFETANGESVAVYYNPNCQPDMGETTEIYAQTKICVHFIYDLNGSKGPNTINKDMGIMSVIYPTDSVVVAPYVHPQDASTSIAYDGAAEACTNQDSEYRMPNRYELMSMFASQYLLGMGNAGYNTSSLLQVNNSNLAWRLAFPTGMMQPIAKSTEYYLRCVKR